MALNINKLIQVAEQAIEDPNIGFAASAEYRVQDFTLDDQQYRMFITIKHMDVVEAEASRMIPYSEPDEDNNEF